MAIVGIGSKVKEYEAKLLIALVFFPSLIVSLVLNWHTVSAIITVLGSVIALFISPTAYKRLITPFIGTVLMFIAYLVAYRLDLTALSPASLILTITPWLLISPYLREPRLWRIVLLGLTTYGIFLAITHLPSQVIEFYRQGNVLQTPIHHGTWSLLIGLPSVWLLWTGYRRRNLFDGLIGLLGIVYVHAIGSRIGIVGIWLAIAIFLWQFIKNKGFFTKAWILIAIWFSGLAMYYTIPTFQMRVRYAFYDIGQIMNNRNVVDFSDSKRIASWIAGLNALEGNYLLGNGHHSAKSKVNKFLMENFGFSREHLIVPHNEFLWMVVRAGFVGLVLFTLGLFLFINSTWNVFTASVHLAYLIRMLIDVPLGTQHGILGYIVLLTWAMAMHKFFSNGHFKHASLQNQ
ncbi:MAG: O-antigen ligase family protein [Chlorobi bacterium]|nr:O-antigen ligase family protein [Chlorobiota bacterium]